MTPEQEQPSITETQYVVVYRYVYWDEASQSHQTSDRYATLEVIKCGLGNPVIATGKKIPVTDLIEGAFAN